MKKILIILLSSILSLNLSAQFRSTSMYMDNMHQVEQPTYQCADEYLQSVSYNPGQNQEQEVYIPNAHRAPGKPNDPYPTSVDDRAVPVVLIVFALGFGVYKFVKENDK